MTTIIDESAATSIEEMDWKRPGSALIDEEEVGNIMDGPSFGENEDLRESFEGIIGRSAAIGGIPKPQI